MGRHDHPEVSMHTHALAEYMKCIDRDDWKGVGDLMLSSANKLAAIGADFLICPDNTIHQSMPYVESQSPLPWLHIAREVGAEAERRGFQRIGLTGTRYLVLSDVYPAGYVRPTDEEREEINRIIFDELSCTEIPLIINDANSPLPTLDSTRLLARAALQRAV
jgi:aspartate racemase